MDSFEKTPRQREESQRIREEANRVVDSFCSGRSGQDENRSTKRKELKPLINFEADDTPPAFETLFGSERIKPRPVRV